LSYLSATRGYLRGCHLSLPTRYLFVLRRTINGTSSGASCVGTENALIRRPWFTAGLVHLWVCTPVHPP
jgi:hypothetical protein